MPRNAQEDIDDNDEEDDDDNISSEGVSSNKKSSSLFKSKWEKTKKKYILEDNDHIVDNNSIDNKENVDNSEIFVEKSPKGRFGRFDEELGSGAIKRVFKGYDFNEGRDIAWNQINVQNMNEKELEKITEEVNLLKKLNHPNIINYISGWFDEEKKEIVIITEIFTGGSLRKHLHKLKHPRLKLIKFWIREILKGLNYLHKYDPPIIHRDIKCDNIFINSQDGTIKIGDLGFSCMMKDSYAKSFLGTPEFMAPEVYKGKYGLKADIYSLGMCVLEMVTIEKPYKECENIYNIFENSEKGILPKAIYKILDEKMFNFIASCLKPEEQRKSAEELLQSPFLNDLEGEENSNPVKLVDSTYSLAQTTNNSPYSNTGETSKNKRNKKEDLIQKKSLYANPNPHSNGEIQCLSNSNFFLSKTNNQVHHSTINIKMNDSNKDLPLHNKQEDGNLNNKGNDSSEQNNQNILNKEQMWESHKNISSNSNNLMNFNNDPNKSVSDYGNNNFKNEKNIDSFICNNSNYNSNFSKNDLINFSSTDNIKTSDVKPKNQAQSIYNDQLYPDIKKNPLVQSNNKNQFSSNDSNTLILTHNQDKNITSSVLGLKSQDIINPNYSSNKKIINIKEASSLSKKNSNAESESQKLREIKKNIYNGSNHVENQEHSLTHKVSTNTTPSILKDKKFNLNENILNNANLKLVTNQNITNQLSMNRKENENNHPTGPKNSQIISNVKHLINHPINNPIINYINNSTVLNNNVKKDNQSNAFSNFEKKRYNLKKFQTSTDTQGKKHSVSLKQYLNNNHNILNNNNNSSFSKFQINIVQNTPENMINYESTDGNPSNIDRKDSNQMPGMHSDMSLKKEYEKETNDPNMVKIKFVVNKDEWKKKKQITFDYNIKTDTIEGVVNELQIVIGLTEEENKLVLEKLNNFISKYHQEGFSSTTPELDNYNKQKKDLEDVNNKMNKMINKMKSFIKENEELFNSIQNEKNTESSLNVVAKTEIENQKMNCMKMKMEINEKVKLMKDFIQKINNSSNTDK